jgi:hypothetical protein
MNTARHSQVRLATTNRKQRRIIAGGVLCLTLWLDGNAWSQTVAQWVAMGRTP